MREPNRFLNSMDRLHQTKNGDSNLLARPRYPVDTFPITNEEIIGYIGD